MSEGTAHSCLARTIFQCQMAMICKLDISMNLGADL